jgi:small GTP-binding protein
MPEKFLKKVCLLGDGAVGKTSLVRRFVSDQFEDKYILTVGTKVVKRDIKVNLSGSEAAVTLMIWDILGQRMHDSLHAAYYSGASGALIVCDITRRETFDHVPEWIEAFRKSSPNSCVLLLANKSDLPSWAATKDELEAMARKYDANGYLTSAKTGQKVEQAFGEIALKMCTEASKPE